MRTRSIAILSALLVLTATAFAQLREGRVLTSGAKIPLLAKLPRGLFCSEGVPLDTIRPGETLTVISTRTLSCALVRREFAQVRRQGRGIPITRQTGYVTVRNTSFIETRR